MRRLIILFFWAYTTLTIYLYARLFLGWPYQLWTFFLHPVLALAFSFFYAVHRDGKRRAFVLLALSVVLTLLAESVGVATGWIFGNYHYTSSLGRLFLGLVPYVIPMVWFYMMYPAYVMADWILPRGWDERWRILGLAAVTGGIMLSWDLVLDPVMVQRGHWVWDQAGDYFGIPLQNFWGWWLTTFITMLIYLKISSRIPQVDAAGLNDRWAIWGYAVMGFGTVLSAVHAGLFAPAAIGAVAMLFWVLWAFCAVSPARPPQP